MTPRPETVTTYRKSFRECPEEITASTDPLQPLAFGGCRGFPGAVEEIMGARDGRCGSFDGGGNVANHAFALGDGGTSARRDYLAFETPTPGISTNVFVMPRLEISGGSLPVDRLNCCECAASAG